MLFMGMLAGLYPAERDNLHIIRVRAKPRVSDCNVVSVKPCAGCPVGQKTHFPGFWGGGCVVIFHGATTHSTGLMLSGAVCSDCRGCHSGVLYFCCSTPAP
uniref:Uncharacterized protein n=1 Tax=Escherichia coli TaxID=562 RepID=A0A6G6AJS7_ECOLX|nr:hypothetical protein pOT-ESBL-0589_00047 [Escherichia coli]